MPIGIGSKYNDNGGVHTNSGVLNRWFYLLSVGGMGVNDKGNSFSVSSIGITKAAKIAYLTEKLLSPTSGFSTARTMSLQAVTTLYGAASAEYKAVFNAWYAVGLGGSIAYGSSSTRFIDLVALNALARFSTSDGGYYDGVAGGATKPALPRCSQQTMLHSAGFTGAVSSQYWNVYIDFNQDNDFSDAGERVVTNKLVANDTWIATSFGIPSSALPGNTRMRVIMSAAATSVTCGSVGSGEVEDYPVVVTAAVALPTPTGLSTSNLTTTSADLHWTAVTGAVSYNVRYHVAGPLTLWLSAGPAVTTTSMTLAGLTAGTKYVFDVQAVNACGTLGIYSTAVAFTTPASRPLGPPAAPPVPSVTAEAYPTPTSDVLHLTLPTDLDGRTPPVTDVVVYDLKGARVQQARYEGDGTLRVTDLAPGLYTASVLGGAAPASVRFVKQ